MANGDLLVITKDGLDKALSSPAAFLLIWQERGYYVVEGDIESLLLAAIPSGELIGYAELTEDYQVAGAETFTFELMCVVNHTDRRAFEIRTKTKLQNTTTGQRVTIKIQRSIPTDAVQSWVDVDKRTVKPVDGTAEVPIEFAAEEFLDPGVYVYRLAISRTDGAGTSWLRASADAKTTLKAVQH